MSESDESGLVSSFEYYASDLLKSVSTPQVGTVAAQRTEYEYDAAGRVRFKRVGPVGGEQLVYETQYNKGGRVVLTKAPGMGTDSAAGTINTRFTYSGGGRDVFEYLYADTALQASRGKMRYADGRTKNISGTAVVWEQYEYAINQQGYPTTSLTRGPSQKRAVKTTYDLLGRVVSEERPGLGVSGDAKPLVTYYEYNDRGLPDLVYTVEQPAGTAIHITGNRVMEYDEFGGLKADGLDLDGNGVLERNSTDRYTEYADGFYKDSANGWWRQQIARVLQKDNSSECAETTKFTRISESSAFLSKVMSIDAFGATETQTVYADPATSSRRTVVMNTAGVTHETESVGGFVRAERWYEDSDPTRAGTPALQKVWTIDPQGRTSTVQDARRGTAQTAYWHGTAMPRYQYDERGVLTTSLTYDAAGRVSAKTDAAGTANYAYDDQGHVTTQSGTGALPTQREYNFYGELWKLHTYRSGISGEADTTTWNYDDNTGWLVSVTDAVNKSVTFNYAYSEGIKTVTRTNARQSTATTEYALNTGDLLNKSYSDGTPGVSYTYYRSGLVQTATDAGGTRTFTYDRGRLDKESLGGWWQNLILKTQRQSSSSTAANTVAGRTFGFGLGYATNAEADWDLEMKLSYEYDNLGRVGSVASAYRAQGSRAALNASGTYHYRANSNLWDSYTQGTFVISREPEANRDYLTSITATHGTTGTIASWGYQTDSAGRREWATQAGMAFQDMIEPTYYRYGYDGAGQLQSATGYRGSNPGVTTNPMEGRGFGFTYDTAGNRTAAAVDSDSVGYTDGNGNGGGNKLNQVKQRGTLKTHVSGTASATAAVTVDGLATGRANGGRCWDVALPGYGQNTSASVVASKSGLSNETRSVAVVTRPSSEELTYDDDGNLKSDSQWGYDWDAENRLTRVYVNPLSSWGQPDRELAFTYDYLGRRIRRVLYVNGAVASDRKYIYDGWNMVAELDTASGRVVRSYVWGLDVTGSLTAAGGVGALLMETVHTTTSLSAFHVVSDGNGNVGALVSLTGAVGAAYEYGPFGENVRTQTFDVANLADQPFRFSTKFTDVETSLVYYGYRFYSPSLGRFISRDPVGEVGGHNLYAFVGNSPIDRWDYLGMWSFKELFSNFFNLFSQDHSEGARTTPAEVESENEKESIFSEPNNGRKVLHLPDGSAADEDGKEWVYLTGANDRGTNGKWHKAGNSEQKSPNGTKASTAPNSPASGTGRVMVIPGDIRGGIYGIYGQKSTESGHRVMKQVVPVVYVGPAASAANIAKFEASVRKYWAGKKYGDDAMAHEIASIDFVPAGTDRAGTPKGLVVYIAADGYARSVYDGGRNIIGFNVDDRRDYAGAHEFGHYMGLRDLYEEVQDPEAPDGVRTRWKEAGAENHLMGGGTGLDWADFLPAWRAMQPR